MVALLLALVGVPAYQQFTPGRIDHHNVQIALTMLTFAATVWADRWRHGAMAAGVLSGAALAIGFECAPYLAACGGVFALRYWIDERTAPDLMAYGRWLVASSIAGFFVTIGSQFWLRHSCDSIAVNTLAAVIGGGLVLVFAGWLRHEDRLTRGFAIVSAASVAAAALLVVEPACSRGPFAMVDPAIWPIWLGDVREMQPLMTVFQKNPLTGAAIAAFPALAVLATLVILTERKARRDVGVLATAALFVIAVAVTMNAIRGVSYAIWFGMPLVAAMALRLFAALQLTSVFARSVASLMLTPLVLSTGAITMVNAAGLNDRDPFDRPASKACVQNDSYAELAKLPPGIVATDVSYGPFVLALTPHAVLAGPYHHLSKGIIEAHRSIAARPDEAPRRAAPEQGHLRRHLRAASAGWAGRRGPDFSLWGRLRAGAVPDWLEPVGDPSRQVFAIYRMKH